MLFVNEQVGNVYVQFREEEHAAAALQNLSGRFYAGYFFVFHVFLFLFYAYIFLKSIIQNLKFCHDGLMHVCNNALDITVIIC